MESKRSLRVAPQIVLGIIIIMVGVLFMLDHMGVLYASDYLCYWPVLIILYGLARIAQPWGVHGRFGGFVWLLVGIALLIDTLGFMGLRFKDFWPVLLVLFGFLLIRRSWTPRTAQFPHTDTDAPASPDDVVLASAFMSGVRRTITSQDFKGGNLTAFMGGCEIDLRQASISSGKAVLDIFAWWGGINIKVPPDWTVVVEATPFMGGIDDKTVRQPVGTPKQLVIRGLAIMGGVDIKN
jgi:predicted membrane protein